MQLIRVLALALLVRGQDDWWPAWAPTRIVDGEGEAGHGDSDSPSRIRVTTCDSCEDHTKLIMHGTELDRYSSVTTQSSCCELCQEQRASCMGWTFTKKSSWFGDFYVCHFWSDMSGLDKVDESYSEVSGSCGEVPTTTTSQVATYTEYLNMHAHEGHGAEDIDDQFSPKHLQSSKACEDICTSDNDCGCVAWQEEAGNCWRRKNCAKDWKQFEDAYGYTTYVKSVSPTTPPPGPPTTSTPSTPSTPSTLSTTTTTPSVTTTTTSTTVPKQQGTKVWIPIIASIGGILVVAACIGGFWFGRKPALAREHAEPLFDQPADPEVCLPPRVDSGAQAKVSTAAATTCAPTPACGSEAPQSRDGSQPDESAIQLAREARPESAIQPDELSRLRRAATAPKPELQPAPTKVDITVRVDDELIYFRVPGAATATVAGEWAWPGTALWHAVTAAPKHVDGLWELGPMQQQLSPDFRVTVDGLMLQTSTHEALAEQR